jgi:hypothetical protein
MNVALGFTKKLAPNHASEGHLPVFAEASRGGTRTQFQCEKNRLIPINMQGINGLT